MLNTEIAIFFSHGFIFFSIPVFQADMKGRRATKFALITFILRHIFINVFDTTVKPLHKNIK